MVTILNERKQWRKVWVVIAGLLAISPAISSGAQTSPTGSARSVVPLVGDWELNLARTHYGTGVDRRRSKRFSCADHVDPVSRVALTTIVVYDRLDHAQRAP